MSRIIEESALLLTSSANDIKCSGGIVSITGLKTTTPLSAITSISQVKYQAEVAQVVTVAGTSYTPVGGTAYTVWIWDPLRRQAGYQEFPYKFSYTTPSDITILGATAALQREAIHGELVSQINALTGTIHATAASSGGGAGFTVTDAGGYYPVWSQTMTNILGPNTVIPVTNGDGSGFASTNFSVTTAAVFSVGVGAKLAQEAPVTDAVFGNLISGKLTAPPVTITGATAVSGQKYDAFIITSLSLANAIGITDQYLYQVKAQTIWVDNGTGTSTSNLAGFIAFQRQFIKLIGQFYKNDPSAIIITNDTKPVCQGGTAGLPTGTSLDENVINLGGGQSTHYFPLGNATIVALTADSTGILCVLDATAGEGVEVSAPTWSTSAKNATVGQTAFSIYARITVDDATGVDPMWVGFRKQSAANATYTSYTDYAFIGISGAAAALGKIQTSTELNSGGTTTTDTTQRWTDGETHELEVRVDINGAVTFFIDGYKPTVTQTFTFDSGDVLIPVFCYALQSADIGTPALGLATFVTGEPWRS